MGTVSQSRQGTLDVQVVIEGGDTTEAAIMLTLRVDGAGLRAEVVGIRR